MPKNKQIQKFKDKAREIECSDDEAAFDEALKALGTKPSEGALAAMREASQKAKKADE